MDDLSFYRERVQVEAGLARSVLQQLPPHLLDFSSAFKSAIGRWRAHYTPKLKKRTALLRKLEDVFRRYQSQPVVQLINPMLRVWINYFAVGHSSECFSFIKDWVEKKIRRHMGRSRNRRGFGWKRWSRRCCTRS